MALLTPWLWTSCLQKWDRIIFYRFRHPVCGTCLRHDSSRRLHSGGLYNLHYQRHCSFLFARSLLELSLEGKLPAVSWRYLSSLQWGPHGDNWGLLPMAVGVSVLARGPSSPNQASAWLQLQPTSWETLNLNPTEVPSKFLTHRNRVTRNIHCFKLLSLAMVF